MLQLEERAKEIEKMSEIRLNELSQKEKQDYFSV